jgi:hypothetical protein
MLCGRFRTGSDDHARYLLQHVVDSLTRPFAGSAGEHTGLYELASGVIRIAKEPLRSELLQLTEGSWESAEGADTFAAYVHRLADQLQQHTALGERTFATSAQRAVHGSVVSSSMMSASGHASRSAACRPPCHPRARSR